MENDFFHCFWLCFTYILMPHSMIILHFRLPWFHILNSPFLHSALVLSFCIDVVLTLSIEIFNKLLTKLFAFGYIMIQFLISIKPWSKASVYQLIAKLSDEKSSPEVSTRFNTTIYWVGISISLWRSIFKFHQSCTVILTHKLATTSCHLAIRRFS